MIPPLSVMTLPLPPVDRQEVLRYAAAREETPELKQLLDEVISSTRDMFSCQVCFREFPLNRQDDLLDLGFAPTASRSLAAALSGCDRIILFAATAGLPLDRQILRHSVTAPAKALLLQALGTERIEALCDSFSEWVRRDAAGRGLRTTNRFSPGYGDLPLELQREIVSALDCQKALGITLNESLVMSPSKSVTALIGLGADCTQTNHTGCSHCPKTDCIHRRSL